MRFTLFALLVGLTLPAVGTTQGGTDGSMQSQPQGFVAAPQDVAWLFATLPVTNLRFTVVGTTVRFEWDPSSESIVSYILEAGTATSLSNIVVFDTQSMETTFSAANVPTGVYFVRVRALGSDGIPGPASNEVVVRVGLQCSAAPNSTGALTQQVAGNQVFLSWLAPAFGDLPTSYVIEAGTGASLADVGMFDTGTAATSYSATVPSGVYFVRVRSRNSCGLGPASNEVIVTIACQPPGPPMALASQINGNQLTLTWSPPLSGGPITSYMMEAGTASGLSNLASFETQSSSTTLTQPGVPPGTYWVRARARNACGLGAVSPEISFEVTGGPGPLDCIEGPWSEWQGTTEWSACTNGRHSRSEIRTRSIIRPAQPGGRACGPLEETRVNTESCGGPVVDCVVSEWSAWQPISEWSACVNGQQSRIEQRTRIVLVPAENGGKVCPPLQETRQQTQACSPPTAVSMRLFQTQPPNSNEVTECVMVGNSSPFGGNSKCELRGSSSSSTPPSYSWVVTFGTPGLCTASDLETNTARIQCVCTTAPQPPPAFQFQATLTVKNSFGQATAGPNFYTVLPAT